MPLPIAPAQQPQAPQGQPAPQAPTPAQLPQPFQALAAGEVPAVRFPAESKTMSSSPIAAWVSQNLDSVARAGVDFFETKRAESIFFNPLKVSKEHLKALEEKGELDKIPEIKALTPPKAKKPLAARTVHTSAPAGALADAQQPPPVVNGAGAPAGAPASPDGPGPAGTVIPQAPVKQDKKLMGQRVSALKNEDQNGARLPASVSDKLSKRAV